MRQSDEPTDRERCEMEIIKSLMRSYFDIARKNFQVPVCVCVCVSFFIAAVDLRSSKRFLR